MTSDTRTREYAAIVAEAEASVASVKDPELRRVAFEKILNTLLETASSAGHARTKQTIKGKSAGRSTGKRRINKQPKGPKSYISQLIDDGFFKTQRTIAQVKAELANQGYHIPMTSLSGPLQALTRERRLRRSKTQATDKGKTTFAYSTW